MTTRNRTFSSPAATQPAAGYLLRWKGREWGPLTLEQIQQQMHMGELSRMHQIQAGGEWSQLGSFLDGLASTASAPAPPDAHQLPPKASARRTELKKPASSVPVRTTTERIPLADSGQPAIRTVEDSLPVAPGLLAVPMQPQAASAAAPSKAPPVLRARPPSRVRRLTASGVTIEWNSHAVYAFGFSVLQLGLYQVSTVAGMFSSAVSGTMLRIIFGIRLLMCIVALIMAHEVLSAKRHPTPGNRELAIGALWLCYLPMGLFIAFLILALLTRLPYL